MIRVLLVDDSILFRNQIQLALRDCDDIVIVGTASNGRAALRFLEETAADICILDVEMPVMDGLETLSEFRKRKLPIRTIMFSGNGRASARKTLEAMRLGAMDFVVKPATESDDLTPAEKIRQALLPRIRGLSEKPVQEVPPPRTRAQIDWESFSPRLIVIASSTGGPQALADFFTAIGTSPVPVPVVVAQHMPALFTTMLGEQIATLTGKVSREAIHDEILLPNQIYIVPGNYHLKLSFSADGYRVKLDQGDLRNYVRPCADYLFETAADLTAEKTLGIVFTGMGRDGADGCRKIKEKKGAVMIQDQASSVVFGMPGAVFHNEDQDFMGTPADLARKVLSLFRQGRRANVA